MTGRLSVRCSTLRFSCDRAMTGTASSLARPFSDLDISEISECCGILDLSYQDSDSGATATFGMEWAFSAVTLRGEWEVFFLEEDLQTDVLSIGLKWEF